MINLNTSIQRENSGIIQELYIIESSIKPQKIRFFRRLQDAKRGKCNFQGKKK